MKLEGGIRGVERGCIPLNKEKDPNYREFFEKFEDRGSWQGDAGRGCKAAPTTPWKVRAPQAKGFSFFEVLSEYVENTIVALKKHNQAEMGRHICE